MSEGLLSKMKLGIMQPYFFPYIGYWQLMNAVDKYVIYDDVAYIKGGWINRNRIKGTNESIFINVQIQKVSQNKLINELNLFRDNKNESKTIKSIELSYKNAPYFKETMNVIEQVRNCGEKNLAKFLTFSIKKVAEYLKINTEFIVSSELEKDNSLKGQDKILDICRRLNADVYINAIGGMELYSFDQFRQNGIDLAFLRTDEITYNQMSDEFIPNLSIIDVMMYNSVDDIRRMLSQYTLINNSAN